MDQTEHTTTLPGAVSASMPAAQPEGNFPFCKPDLATLSTVTIRGWAKRPQRRRPIETKIANVEHDAEGFTLELDGGTYRGRPHKIAVTLPSAVIAALSKLLELGALCECGHALSPDHVTPGAECSKCEPLGACPTFRAVKR